MDVFQQLTNMGGDLLTRMQILAGIVCALALGWGGFQHMFGGPEGIRKAKPWYIGGVVGFIIVLGAKAFAAYIKSKTLF